MRRGAGGGGLEFEDEAEVELATCQVIGDGILDVVDVCNPVITAYVGDVEEVENIKCQCDVLEMTPEVVRAHPVFLIAHKLITHPDIYTFISRSSEI